MKSYVKHFYRLTTNNKVFKFKLFIILNKNKINMFIYNFYILTY